MSVSTTSVKNDLIALAKEVLSSRGLQPNFPESVNNDVAKITQPATPSSPKQLNNVQDLRQLLWCSIDNDDSLDLDQLTYAEKTPDGNSTIWIAVADVDALVSKDSPVDLNAQINTTSIYTPGKMFPMLPLNLSTNLTSLNENEDRLAMVVKIHFTSTGEILDSSIFQAYVRNHAKLTYSTTGPWLEATHSIPEKIARTKGLEETLRIQHRMAQILKKKRQSLGSLTLESSQVTAKVNDKDEIILEVADHNYAHQLIEEFMVASNYAMATQLRKLKIASLRRVVRKPIKWDKIVMLANSLGEGLPPEPDSKALDGFLVKRKEIDPVGFKDLSLMVIKLMGRGEYVVENVGDTPIGHFGLAISNYTHSTAPNRRYPDIITQRQYKAHLQGAKPPYNIEDLNKLANRCTEQEDASSKAERRLNKSAAAILLEPLIGTRFKGIITGVNLIGTWVRIFKPPVEGKLIKGFEKLDVGDRVTVTLVSVNIHEGFIDFEA